MAHDVFNQFVGKEGFETGFKGDLSALWDVWINWNRGIQVEFLLSVVSDLIAASRLESLLYFKTK